MNCSFIHLSAGNGLCKLVQPVSLNVLCLALVAELGNGGIHRKPCGVFDAVLGGDSFDLALAEDLVTLAAVGAPEITHILNETENGNIHHLCHIHSLLNNHTDQILRRGHDDDALDGKRLENGEGNIAGSGRHIYEHIVNFAPVYIGPELLDNTRDNGTAPDNGCGVILQKKVDGHNLDAVGAYLGLDALLACLGAILVETEHLGNGGTGYISVQNGGVEAAAAHLAGHKSGYKALANAALTGYNGNYIFNIGISIHRLNEALGFGAGCAVGAAA